MNFEQLSFVTFCVGIVAEKLQMSADKVYGLFRSSGLLTEYILPSFDVLHTFSGEYLADDLISNLKEKDAL